MSVTGGAFFSLKLGGTKLDAALLAHVVSISFVEGLDKLDSLSVQLAIPPVKRAKVLALCKVGQPFEVQLGYGDSAAMQGYGDIVEVRHGIGADAPWTVTLRGVDGLHRLGSAQKPRIFSELSHADIVKKVAGDAGFSADVQGVSTTPEAVFTQAESAAKFLRRLARENNYFVRVVEKKLSFGRRNQPAGGKVTLEWGKDLEQIDLTANLQGLYTTVRVVGHDEKSDKPIEAKATDSDLKKISGGEVGAALYKSAFGEQIHQIPDAPYQSTSAATAKAKAELQEKAEKFLGGTITCRGTPTAHSGGTVTCKGLPWPFTGPFLITETTHTLEPTSGYRTTITIASDSLPKAT
ncbi:MAG: contractile injection system protein, VgrG/Pvc8 family [Pseudomonadota bacterium]